MGHEVGDIAADEVTEVKEVSHIPLEQSKSNTMSYSPYTKVSPFVLFAHTHTFRGQVGVCTIHPTSARFLPLGNNVT